MNLWWEIKDWMLWLSWAIIAALVISNIAGFFMGTSTPFIAVTTISMTHDQTTPTNYVAWMLQRNFTQTQLEAFPFQGGISASDAIIVLGPKPKDINVGDVIVYNNPAYSMPIIHRVIEIIPKDGTLYFQTKGDHNPVQDPWLVAETDVEGRAWLLIPFLGILNTIYVQFILFLRRG